MTATPAPPALAGARYGRLVVVECLGRVRRSGTVNRTEWLYRLRCDCGGTKDVAASVLRRGKTRSCGCLHHENAMRQTRINGVNRLGRISGFSSLPANHGDGDDETWA